MSVSKITGRDEGEFWENEEKYNKEQIKKRKTLSMADGLIAL
jgi:hypothetical protein